MFAKITLALTVLLAMRATLGQGQDHMISQVIVGLGVNYRAVTVESLFTDSLILVAHDLHIEPQRPFQVIRLASFEPINLIQEIDCDLPPKSWSRF